MKKLVLGLVCVWSLLACVYEPGKQVGSNCDEDCQLQSEQGSCTLYSVRNAFPSSLDPRDGGLLLEVPDQICLSEEFLPGPDGLLPCEVVAVPDDEEVDLTTFCARSPALTPTEPDAEIAGCVVTQLLPDTDAGVPGWAFGAGPGECGETRVANIPFPDDAAVPDYALYATCIVATVATGDHVTGASNPTAPISVNPEDCLFAREPSAESVGTECLPDYVPPGGFHNAVTYIETASVTCPGGVCMVHWNGGDFDVDNGYCSCDCGERGGRPGCECPTGYRCTEVFDDPALQSPSGGTSGNFCVKRQSTLRSEMEQG